jgi:hypothetical protein
MKEECAVGVLSGGRLRRFARKESQEASVACGDGKKVFVANASHCLNEIKRAGNIYYYVAYFFVSTDLYKRFKEI